MTASEFVDGIEGYYGQYPNQIIKGFVMSYVEDAIPEEEREAVLRMIYMTVSTQYRSVPDVARIREIRDKNANEIAKLSGKVWQDETGRVYLGCQRIGRYGDRQFYPWFPAIPEGRDKEFALEDPKSADAMAAFVKKYGDKKALVEGI